MSLTTLAAGAFPASTVVATAQNAVRGWAVQPAPLVWPAKDPLSTVEPAIDFGPVLGGRTLVPTFTGQAASIVASGVTVVACSSTGSVVSVILRGGVDGTPGQVQVRAFCDDGTDVVRAVVQPIVAVLTISGIDQSQPQYLDVGGALLTFNGAAVLLGRTSPTETLNLLGSLISLDGAPLSLALA